MSKKKVRGQKQRIDPQGSKRRKFITVAAISLMVTLGLGAVLGPWADSLAARKLRALLVAPFSPPPIPPPSNPSKEYIYAGGKLIATEEPVPLAAPVNLTAETLSGSQVDITWTASPGADHYQVERTQNLSQAYTIVSSSVTTTSFSDNTVSSGSAYLYRVRAVAASANFSPPSNVDLATAITFSDDPLAVGSTPVKGQHLTELRQAVNAIRATANLSVASWTDSLLAGVTIKAVHFQELRTNLDQALLAVGLTTSSYTDPSLPGIAIKKVHMAELRQAVK